MRTLQDIVEEQLDKGRPDDDAEGWETIDNRERGCGFLKRNAAYVRTDVSALSHEDGEVPRFVEFDEPIEYREHSGNGSIIPGYKEIDGNSFTLHYDADGYTTTPAGDIQDHVDRLQRHGFDGEHYGEITSARAKDLLMSVGKTNWETPEDYIQECRERGLNLKIPVTDRQHPPVIEPLRTRVFIIHPHGAGEDRPGIIGYSYLTRTVFTTGTEATAQDPDVPRWASDYAKAGYMDIVQPGKPIEADDDETTDVHPDTSPLTNYEVGDVPIEHVKNGKTTVVNLRETDDFDVYVGRSESGHMGDVEPKNKGWLGNPFPVNDDRTRQEAVASFIDAFEHKLNNNPTFREHVNDLRGKTLGCYCHPKPCHGHVIATYLNTGTVPETVNDAVAPHVEDNGPGTGELSVAFDDNLSEDVRRKSFETNDIPYNMLKEVTARRDDVEVGATPKQDELVDALVEVGGFVQSYTEGGEHGD